MTDDELRMNIESLHAACHELFEASQRHDAQMAENGRYIRALAQIAEETLDAVKRLERIATAHQDHIEDHERRIEDLEG